MRILWLWLLLLIDLWALALAYLWRFIRRATTTIPKPERSTR